MNVFESGPKYEHAKAFHSIIESAGDDSLTNM